MSYTPAKASKANHASDNDMIVDLILRNKTATQFIEQFNASEEIDFFNYAREKCEPFGKKYGNGYDSLKTLEITRALLSRVTKLLAQVASEKIKTFSKTQAAWEFFAATYVKRDVYMPQASIDLRDAYISASRNEYATFVDKFEEVLSMSEFAGLSLTYDHDKIARIAFSMYTNQVNHVEQIELPDFEF